jgi:hypothetical protein
MKKYFHREENFAASGCKFQQIAFPVQKVRFPDSGSTHLPRVAKPAQLIPAPLQYAVALLLYPYLPTHAKMGLCIFLKRCNFIV